MGLKILLLWLVLASIYSFVAMYWDKKKAIAQKRRISEKSFFIMAALGGSLGIIGGMKAWRHKTHKWRFKLPVFLILFLQLMLPIAIYFFT